MIIKAGRNKVFRRIHDGFVMGNKVNLGMDYSTGTERVDLAEYYEEIDNPQISLSLTVSGSQINKVTDTQIKWQPGEQVYTDDPNFSADIRVFNGKLYSVIQSHVTQAEWTPDVTPALWKEITPVNVIPDFVQPTGAHDAYNTGDKVIYENNIYESIIDNNVWSPGDYPAGWKQQ